MGPASDCESEMEFPHRKFEPDEFGHSPGNGMTPMSLSRDPLATEGEATPGPDDYNPYEDGDELDAGVGDMTSKRDPTEGDDPFTFDDVGDAGSLPDFGIEPDDSLFEW